MSILENLHVFLGTDNKHETNLQERTKSAIVLLRSLPCARSAVLEQIGDVFHEAAKKYVIELESQLLSGQPEFSETSTPELDSLVKDIQKTLSGFIECNHDAWAPQIARWSVNLVGSLCSKYGILRAFSNLPIDERLQLWMNCPACRILMEIAVTCFGYIIEDSPDVCVDYLLETAADNSPYFDWAIAHMCCCFLDVIPYGILSHALVAFSMQAKNAEMVINCVTRVYNFLLSQHGKVLQNAVLDLFKDSVSAETVAIGSDQEHIDKCTLPFLLHLALQAPRLVDQISEKVTDLLDMKTIAALSEQANKREVILQRGLLSRVLDILKNVSKGNFKILIFLINSSCFNDDSLSQDDGKHFAERKRICSTLLEMLLLHLHENIQNILTQKKTEEEDLVEEPIIEITFVKGLQKHLKSLCRELLTTDMEMKSNILLRVLALLSLHGGIPVASEAITTLLIKATSRKHLSHLLALQCELEAYDDNILEKSLINFAEKLCTGVPHLTNNEVMKAIKNCICLVEQELFNIEPERMKLKDCLRESWYTLSNLSCFENYEVAHLGLKLLDSLSLPPRQPLPGIYSACQNLITAYFNFLQRLSKDLDNDDFWEILKLSEKLLLQLVKQNMVLQQTAVRIILQTVLQEEHATLIMNEDFQNEHEENSLISEPKVQLLERNNAPDVVSRIPINRSSVNYVGSLNRHKRKCLDNHQADNIVKTGIFQQFILATLDSLLSFRVGTNEKSGTTNKTGSSDMMDVDHHQHNNFSDAILSRLQDGTKISAYSFMATLLAEIICPDVIPTMPWPDEDFLKHTVERDIKIKKQFEVNPFLWEILAVISKERPALCHCIVIIQSLLATCLTYWETDRRSTVKASRVQLSMACNILQLMKEAGWIPSPWCNASDILQHLKPEEAYQLLSCIWRFCKDINLSSSRFTEEHGARTAMIFPSDQVESLRSVFRDIFLKNMASLGVLYKRFFCPG